MNIEKTPAIILEALRKRGHDYASIKAMGYEKAFDEFCNWHGLCGWGSVLREAITALKKADK
jgi:hypothetical protein